MPKTLAHQLLLLTLATAFALIGAVALTAFQLNSLQDDFSTFERSQRVVARLLEIKATALSVARADPVMGETAKQLAQTDAAIQVAVKDLRSLLKEAEWQQMDANVLPRWGNYLRQFQSANKIAESSPQDAMGIPEQIYNNELAPMIVEMGKLEAIKIAEAAALKQEIASAISKVLRSILIVLIATTAGVLICQSIFARVLRHKVQRMESVADQLKTGNLTLRMPAGDDELGKVSGAVNGFIEQLNGILREVEDAVKSTRHVALALGKRAEEVSARTVAQSDDVASIGQAVTELSASVESVADAAGRINDIASHSTSELGRAGAMTEQSLSAIRALQQSVDAAQDTLSTLAGAVQRVDAVSTLIKEIADQTNLLALNAAIEAARAGEAGRGFAVVADEVRKLSERTAGATRDIGSILSGLDARMAQALQAMRSANQQSEQEVVHAEAVVIIMRSIGTDVGQMRGMISSVAGATVQQSHASEEITAEVGQINRLAQETSEAMQSVRQDVGLLNTSAQRLAQCTDRFQLSR